jgi:hypothetical protein
MKTWLLPLALAVMIAPAPAIYSTTAAHAAEQTLGDLSHFVTIANDTLVLVDKGEMKAAERRITDFEAAWDQAEPKLFAKDKAAWSVIDDAADAAIGSLREKKPSEIKAQKTVSALIDSLKHPVVE